MAGGRDGEHLLAVVQELYSELGYAAGEGADGEPGLGSSSELWELLGDPEEGLAGELRRELAKLAEASLQGAGPEDTRAVRAALDGAELVIRSMLAGQRREGLDERLPAIAFVVVLPGLGRERALAVSRRAQELLALG